MIYAINKIGKGKGSIKKNKIQLQKGGGNGGVDEVADTRSDGVSVRVDVDNTNENIENTDSY